MQASDDLLLPDSLYPRGSATSSYRCGGREDLAFPKINLLSLYIYAVGALFTPVCLISGGVIRRLFTHPSVRRTPTVTSFAVGLGISSRLFLDSDGPEFIVTIHRCGAGPEVVPVAAVRLGALPTSIHHDSGTPSRRDLFLLVLERGLHIGFFDPACGGDPVLFQHMFWLLASGVYIMILPSWV